MAKTVLTIKGAECTQATKNKNGSTIQIAANIVASKDGQQATARNGANIIVSDMKVSDQITPGKKYTLTLTED